MLMQEQGTKMYVDAILKTHERVVQVKPSWFFRFNCSKSPFNSNHCSVGFWDLSPELCRFPVRLVEQSGHHVVSCLHGRPLKESAGGSRTVCEGGE